MAEPLSKAKLSNFRKLHQKKTRLRENQFLIEGWHLLDEAMKAQVKLRAVVFDDNRSLADSDSAILSRASSRADSLYTAGDSQLKALGETKTSPGVVSVVDVMPSEWEPLQRTLLATRSSVVVALDGVSDPGNCGSIIRAGDWFGVDAVLLGEGCPDRENGKLVRATMGSLFHLPIVSAGSLSGALTALKQGVFQIVVSALGASESLDGFAWPQKAALVVGNEARGVSAETLALADCVLEIPKFGRGDSLNAALATSVFLGHWRMG